MGKPVGTTRIVPRTLLYTLTVSGIYCYKGCLSGTWWSATAKSGRGTLMGVAFPGRMIGCHHVSSFSVSFLSIGTGLRLNARYKQKHAESIGMR